MRRRNQNVLPNVCFLATLLTWSGGRSLFSQAWSKAIDPIHSEAVPRLLIVRLQTEDVYLHAQQSEANLRAWCDGCQTFGWHCDYHIFRSVPIKSVMYHPSFAHFSTTLMALPVSMVPMLALREGACTHRGYVVYQLNQYSDQWSGCGALV